MLDENLVAEGQAFCPRPCDVSPDGRLLAWSQDTSGDERYRFHVIDLATRAELPAPDVPVAAGGCWCGDERLVYFTVDDAWRPDRVWLHTLGSAGADTLLLSEPDERFWLGVDGFSRTAPRS